MFFFCPEIAGCCVIIKGNVRDIPEVPCEKEIGYY
jgi:hypothetical protein